MKHIMPVIIICSLIVLASLLVVSDAWSVCTIDQRIELGKQGYDKAEVEKMCAESGDLLMQLLSRGVEMGMSKLPGGANNQNANNQNNTNQIMNLLAPSNAASMCVTNNGTCPLRGATVGSACYCRTPNGFTVKGVSQ